MTNGQYGFHRDELATLDDNYYLDWGYISYPPLTPFIGRVALALFGLSLVGIRLFAATAVSISMVLGGLMTGALGGSRLAQIVTALVLAIVPVSLFQGSFFQYTTFDYLWWVLTAWLTIRLLKSENPRWWLGIGATIGLGMMTKYTMAFCVAGLIGGVLVTDARRYLYSAPAYPMLVAAGTVVWERGLAALAPARARLVRGVTWAALVTGGVAFGVLLLPVAPINSALWNVTQKIHDGFTERIGWSDLVEIVATIYARLPAEDKLRTGILTSNYGEAGAINLYGPAYRLPVALSGINSYGLRGYRNAPEMVIAVGFSRAALESNFESCHVAGHVTNRYGVENEETKDHPDIFVCRALRQPWPTLWKRLRRYGSRATLMPVLSQILLRRSWRGSCPCL